MAFNLKPYMEGWPLIESALWVPYLLMYYLNIWGVCFLSLYWTDIELFRGKSEIFNNTEMGN